jgi:hypothetical protein
MVDIARVMRHRRIPVIEQSSRLTNRLSDRGLQEREHRQHERCSQRT